MFLYSTLANGMPILNSRPGAPAAIYLDFNYEPAYGSTGLDWQRRRILMLPSQTIIYNCWQQVSIYYAMFDVNVTTIQPNVQHNPHRLGRDRPEHQRRLHLCRLIPR